MEFCELNRNDVNCCLINYAFWTAHIPFVEPWMTVKQEWRTWKKMWGFNLCPYRDFSTYVIPTFER